MKGKLEFFNKIKLLTSEYYKNHPCRYCVGNGCDDCRDCSELKKLDMMETNIDNLKKQYKELYGSDYEEDRINSLKDNTHAQISKLVTTSKGIIKEWCEKNMNVHTTDWIGTRVETNNTCLSIDEFVDKLWNYLEEESDRMD